jgi:Permuted papain-like amidase enzyme, YaeF/YiiX, C92 family
MNFILKKISNKRWLLGCLLFFLAACSSKNNYNNFTTSKTDSIVQEQNVAAALDSISLYKKIVKTGDLIVRAGIDFTSEAMRLLSTKDKTYSHCGIASIEHDSLFVYHSIGGEWNPDQKLRRDPFIFFCNPYENKGFGIFRYTITAKERVNLINVVHKLYDKKVMFDMQFNLASDDRMYCSEFVYKAIEQATNNNIILPTTTINNIKFIALDNLFINPFCTEIKRIAFNR